MYFQGYEFMKVITNEGKRRLGAVVGTEEFRKEYVIMRGNEWVYELNSKLLYSIRKQYIAHSHQVLGKSSTTLFEP